MHIACVSYSYEPHLKSPEELLLAYSTLSGWAEGLASAGARVTVFQRFGLDAHIECGDVHYHFVEDKMPRAGGPLDRAPRVNQAVAQAGAAVAHVNGLPFAWQAWWLKQRRPQLPVLIQDHANSPPCHWIKAALLRTALRRMDAVSFAAPEQALPWREKGLLQPETRSFSLMEGSSRFRLRSRASARRETGLEGKPLCLWVGRLNANKDPLTALTGFARAAPHLPAPHLAMVYGESELLPEVTQFLADQPAVAGRVTLLGKRPHAELEAIYNSADLFLLGSHHEGSGYAALEALACGVMPVLTDIPSFRALLGRGEVGTLWPAKDPDALAVALLATSRRLFPGMPDRVRAYFEAHWSFEAIGREAMHVYREVQNGRAR